MSEILKKFCSTCKDSRFGKFCFECGEKLLEKLPTTDEQVDNGQSKLENIGIVTWMQDEHNRESGSKSALRKDPCPENASTNDNLESASNQPSFEILAKQSMSTDITDGQIEEQPNYGHKIGENEREKIRKEERCKSKTEHRYEQNENGLPAVTDKYQDAEYVNLTDATEKGGVLAKVSDEQNKNSVPDATKKEDGVLAKVSDEQNKNSAPDATEKGGVLEKVSDEQNQNSVPDATEKEDEVLENVSNGQNGNNFLGAKEHKGNLVDTTETVGSAEKISNDQNDSSVPDATEKGEVLEKVSDEQNENSVPDAPEMENGVLEKVSDEQNKNSVPDATEKEDGNLEKISDEQNENSVPDATEKGGVLEKVSDEQNENSIPDATEKEDGVLEKVSDEQNENSVPDATEKGGVLEKVSDEQNENSVPDATKKDGVLEKVSDEQNENSVPDAPEMENGVLRKDSNEQNENNLLDAKDNKGNLADTAETTGPAKNVSKDQNENTVSHATVKEGFVEKLTSKQTENSEMDSTYTSGTVEKVKDEQDEYIKPDTADTSRILDLTTCKQDENSVPDARNTNGSEEINDNIQTNEVPSADIVNNRSNTICTKGNLESCIDNKIDKLDCSEPNSEVKCDDTSVDTTGNDENTNGDDSIVLHPQQISMATDNEGESQSKDEDFSEEQYHINGSSDDEEGTESDSDCSDNESIDSEEHSSASSSSSSSEEEEEEEKEKDQYNGNDCEKTAKKTKDCEKSSDVKEKIDIGEACENEQLHLNETPRKEDEFKTNTSIASITETTAPDQVGNQNPSSDVEMKDLENLESDQEDKQTITKSGKKKKKRNRKNRKKNNKNTKKASLTKKENDNLDENGGRTDDKKGEKKVSKNTEKVQENVVKAKASDIKPEEAAKKVNTDKKKSDKEKASQGHVTVHFYVNLLQECEAFLDEYEICIHMEPKWYTPVLRMELVRLLQDNTILLHGSTSLRKDLRPTSYKYIFKKKSDSKVFHWEDIQNGYSYIGIANRQLKLRNHNGTKHYQVDDIILPDIKERGFQKKFVNFFNFFKKLISHDEHERIKIFHDKCKGIFIELIQLCMDDHLSKHVTSYQDKMLFLRSLYLGFFESFTRIDNYGPHTKKREMLSDLETRNRFLENIHKELDRNIKLISRDKIDSTSKHRAFFDVLNIGIVLCEQSISQYLTAQLIKSFFEALSLEPFGDSVKELLVEEQLQESSISTHSVEQFWLNVMKRNVTGLSHSWCYPLVLLHFTQGKCTPYANISSRPNLKDTAISGLNGLKKFNDGFIDETFRNIEGLKESLEMDKMLQYCLGNLMKIQHFNNAIESGHFEDALLVQFIAMKLKNEKMDDQKCNELTSVIVLIRTRLTTYKTETQIVEMLKALIDMISTALMDVYGVSSELYSTLFQTILEYDENISTCKDESMKKAVSQKFNSKKSDILQGLKNRYENHDWVRCTEDNICDELKFLDTIFLLEHLQMGKIDGITELAKATVTACSDKLCAGNKEKFLNVYGRFETLYDLRSPDNQQKSETQKIFEEKCIQLLEKVFSGNCDDGFVQQILKYFQKEDNVFLTTFCNEWNKRETPEMKLQHMISWPPMEIFLDFFDKSNTSKGLHVLYTVNIVICEYYENIRARSLTFEEFLYLEKRESILKRIFRRFMPDDHYHDFIDQFGKCLELIKYFQRVTDALNGFVDLCNRWSEEQVDLSSIQKILHQDYKSMKVQCVCLDQSMIPKYYGIDEDLLEEVLCIHDNQLSRSQLIKKIWKGVVKDIRFDESSILESFLLPVKTKARDLLEKIAKGKISIGRVKKYFGKVELGCIGREFNCAIKYVDFDDVSKYASKVECVLKIESTKELADGILEVARLLDLRGNFKVISSIQKMANVKENLTLKQFPMNIVNDTLILTQYNRELSQVIGAIKNNPELVQWVRQTLKGSHEVKTSIAMLKNSAGDNVKCIQAVRCFEESCASFSAIFFELAQISGFSELHKACVTVFETFNPQNSTSNLQYCSSKLDWIKESYKSQKSFSEGAFIEASRVNKNGCYNIGFMKRINFLEGEVDLSSVVKLKIHSPRQEDEKSLDEIQDLQSRLMLLGGDNSEQRESEINFFLQHCDIATQLGNALISLYDAGDDEYLEWRKEFPLNDADILNIKKDIGELDNRLVTWTTEFDTFREKYPSANHFNNKQCLYLRYHLYKLTISIREMIRLPPQVFTLLRSINEILTTKDIENAFQFSYLEQTTEDTSWRTNLNVEVEDNFKLFSVKEIRTFLQVLEEDHQINQSIALASIKRICPFIEKDAILWCDKQDPDDNQIYEDAEEIESELDRFSSSPEGSDQEELNQPSQQPNTFLPLNQFGEFLRALSKLKASRQRKPPDIFHNENLSLIVVPQNDVLRAVLQVYLEKDGELPKAEEILLCNDVVTLDKARLFTMRAKSTEGCLYCLAFADSLDYTVMEFISEELQTYQGPSHVFMVCTSEDKTQSIIIARLQKYVSNKFVLNNNKSLSSKLQRKLCQDDKKGRTKEFINASSIDKRCVNVSVITSDRGGMGKSLYVEEVGEKLQKKITDSQLYCRRRSNCRRNQVKVTVPVHSVVVDVDSIVACLSEYEEYPDNVFPRIYHFDIAPLVYQGLENLFFKVAVLGTIQTSSGKTWRRSEVDLCLFEVTNTTTDTHEELSSGSQYHGVIKNLLPTMKCLSPQETLHALASKKTPVDSERFFTAYLSNEPYQRVAFYLTKFEENELKMLTYDTNQRSNTQIVLEAILRYCGVNSPSWLELQSFVYFFNEQLRDSESSYYTLEIPEFQEFVIKFLLEMAEDFSTRSLKAGEVAELVQLKRRWEQSHHPYLFFNRDGQTFTFFGFRIRNGNLIQQDTDDVIQENIMTDELYQTLSQNMQGDIVNFETNFQTIDRQVKLILLCRVMGLEDVVNPNENYELTSDNVKKMLAIYARLRCGIPVILMGETGCGKTELIRFMCGLRAGTNEDVKNMILVKVHGGVTAKDIVRNVKAAEKRAKKNFKEHSINTILFFDEVNTSDAIGLVKEIMVDKRMHGKPLQADKYGLEIIAACNPYRRHTDLMVEKLKSAGLGYHVSDSQSYEKIGNIPLRQLVYRVHPLPESMKPLVWDFGQLNNATERCYTEQIINKYINSEKFPRNPEFASMLANLLAAAQTYMRNQKNECSFVSLRDVKRTIEILIWFYKKMDVLLTFYQDDPFEFTNNLQRSNEKLRRSLVLALSVCYIARLDNRHDFMEHIVPYFTGSFALLENEKQLAIEIKKFQEMFVEKLALEDNIAKNQALCENIFMMVICIELRIPLFIIGKPGSSKSLAKTIIEDHMQGKSSKSELFKHLKRIDVTSYQCSPLSTADGIVNVFNQSSKYQKDKNLEEFSSVVVLDEVGLAEDSPKMPLKALHPLLEDGTDGSKDLVISEDEKYDKRVAFIGISNWSLDPAKMNRGIMLYRSPPGIEELEQTAKDICASNSEIRGKLLHIFKALAKAYDELYKSQEELSILKKFGKEEFFGLRDFYCLIKMVFCFAKAHGDIPPIRDIEYAVRRNFSGIEELKPWKVFKKHLSEMENVQDESIQVSAMEMISSSFSQHCACSGKKADQNDIAKPTKCLNSRYLLIMTERYSAMPIMESMFLDNNIQPRVIFGSSFPKDQEFTQICRDINEIKLCMETGKTIVLLNMEKLYESLYDALNQYYVYLGGERFVDLGLGTHRVKCKVHKDFKLIVIADKQLVYKTFPIPLINRLEKHIVMMSSSLDPYQKEVSNQLYEWAKDFSVVTRKNKTFGPSDAFIGFNEDTCASLVLKLCQENDDKFNANQIFEAGKRHLLKIATPDAVLRVQKTKLHHEKEDIYAMYFTEQQRNSLYDYLVSQQYVPKFLQVSTFSRLLTKDDIVDWSPDFSIEIVPLVKFDTEYSFRQAIKEKTRRSSQRPLLLIVQYSITEGSNNVVACAQYICKELITMNSNVHVLFLLQLSQAQAIQSSLTGFQSFWDCVHIDDVRSPTEECPSLLKYCDKPVSCLFDEGNNDDIRYILKTSLQPAMKEIIRIKTLNPETISMKIKILQELVEEQSEQSLIFVQLIAKEIHAYLKEKEEVMQNPSYWIPEEASEQHHLPYYLTFRSALVAKLETLILPIWTNLILFLDYNDNLLLLVKYVGYREVWVQLMRTSLESSLCEIDSGNHLTNSMKGSAKFPFSQFIATNISTLIDTRKTLIFENDEKDDIFVSLKRVLSDSQFFQVLSNLSKSELEDFIIDLLALRYPNLVEKAYQVLKLGVTIGMKVLADSLDSDDFNTAEDQVALVYMAMDTFHEELQSTSKIFRSQPSILSKLERRISNDAEIGMLLDLKALRLLLLSFHPSNEKVRRKLVGLSQNKQLNEVSILIKQMLNQQRKIGSSFNNDARNKLIKECKVLWMQIRIAQLYEENVLIVAGGNFDGNSFEKETAFELWKMLQRTEKELIDIETWRSLEVFISRVLNRKIERSASNEKEIESFKKACTRFFVDVVTEFCFTKDALKNENQEIIQIITLYAFSPSKDKTKQFSPLQDDIDKSPVIRSFILQQLLKHDIDVEGCLSIYLEPHYELAVNQTDRWNLYKLFIYCYEDHQAAMLSKLRSGNKFSDAYLKELVNLIDHGLDYLTTNLNANTKEMCVDLLKVVAKIRLAVTEVTNLLCVRYLSSEILSEEIQQRLKGVFPYLLKIIELGRNSEMHMFVLRQIVHKHGFRELQRLITQSTYGWLALQMDQGNTQNYDSDKFLVYGVQYQELRNRLTNIYMERNQQDLKQLTEEITPVSRLLLQFALLRETALSDVDINGEVFVNILGKLELNHLTQFVNVISGSTEDYVIAELLYHFFVMINHSNRSMMQLYYLIYAQPTACQGLFLPTMPSDAFEVIANVQRPAGTGFVPHTCPNGHVYVITECGRASQTFRCPECNAAIGGSGHQLIRNNQRIDNRDETRPGHSLGSPATRVDFAAPERNLSVLSTTLQRLLIHLAMLAGARNGAHQEILHLVTPQLRSVNELFAFLTNHLRHDMRILQDVLGKSNDDTRLVAHLFIKHLSSIRPVVNADVGRRLRTKQGRDAFEMEFHNNYIETFRQDIERQLQETKRLCADDMRISSNPLMKKLYELEPSNEDNISPIHSAELWRHRQPISVECLRIKTQERRTQTDGKANIQLHFFLQNESMYELLSYLPKVLKFQMILHQHLNYRIDKESAHNKTIKEILRNDIKSEASQRELKKLKSAIFKIWNKLSDSLKENGPFKPDADHHPLQFNDNTTLAHFLASDNGPGRCIKSLILYLMTLQNEFLGIYQGMTNSFLREPCKLCELQESNIISYSQENDLLPIIHLNCDYSLEIGKGNVMEYNLEKIEQSLMEKICYGKCFIETPVYMFTYLDQVHRIEEFKSFFKKVEQIAVPYKEQKIMMSTLKGMDNVTNTLKAVETSIGFLSKTGGQENQLYIKYLEETLAYDPKKYLPSEHMKKDVRLTHLYSIWLMLTVERALRLFDSRKEPFSSCPVEFSQPLSIDVRNHLNMEDIQPILEMLTEYIVCDLPLRKPNDAEMELNEALYGFQNIKKMENKEFICDKIPKSVLLSNILEYWKRIAGICIGNS